MGSQSTNPPFGVRRGSVFTAAEQSSPSVYLEKLEPPLLEESRKFYEAEGKRRLETFSATEYIAQVGTCSQTSLNTAFTH